VISINPEDVGATAPCSSGETAGKGVISANTYDRNTRGLGPTPPSNIRHQFVPSNLKVPRICSRTMFPDLGSCSGEGA
jgi:hypothetical protein